jgi:hypothetical protein
VISDLTIAELKLRIADLEHTAKKLMLQVPGRNRSVQYAQRKRAEQQAADYRALLAFAEEANATSREGKA